MEISEIAIVNPCDSDEGSAFLFSFGAYGWTQCIVFARAYHIDTALEHAVEWLDENALGELVSFELDDYKRAAEDLGMAWQAHWPDHEDEDFCKVAEETEVDHTVIGHTTLKNGTHLSSDWGVTEYNDGAEFDAIMARICTECGYVEVSEPGMCEECQTEHIENDALDAAYAELDAACDAADMVAAASTVHVAHAIAWACVAYPGFPMNREYYEGLIGYWQARAEL